MIRKTRYADGLVEWERVPEPFEEGKALAMLKVLNKRATELHAASRPERTRALTQQQADVVLLADDTSACCAGYVPPDANAFRGEPGQAVSELEGVALLDHEEVAGWLAEHGAENPRICAWLFAVELLRVRLIEYYRWRRLRDAMPAIPSPSGG